MKYFLLSVCFIMSYFMTLAQNNSILVTIDKSNYSTEEFQRLFNKNADLVDGNAVENIDQNLQLFIDYQLKIKEAKKQGLDTLPEFIKQVRQYNAQLSEKYLTDPETKEKLAKEAYHRSKYERNVSYIIVMLPKNGDDADSLKAYKKAKEFKDRVTNGEKFEDLAEAYTDDPNFSKTHGNLGWVKVFKTVYPFENTVYKTPVGEVSEPVRSGLSYYVIRVNEERKTSGKISVSQILLKTDQSSPSANVEKKANQIYEELKSGKDFKELVKKYSEDKTSASRMGLLPSFYKGTQPSAKLEEIAFSLSKENPISKPFQTEEGWHILKFNSIELLGSYDEEKAQIERRISRDKRVQLIKENKLKELRKQYKIRKNPEAQSYFESLLGKDLKENLQQTMPNKILFEIENEPSSYQDFADWLIPQVKLHPQGLSIYQLKQLLKLFEDQKMLSFAQKQLYQNNKEYAHKINDYKNGILVFDLMSKNVWEKEADSTELQDFYKKYQDKMTTPSPQDFTESKGEVYALWQEEKEKEFIEKLRQGSAVKVNNKEVENLKKSI